MIVNPGLKIHQQITNETWQQHAGIAMAEGEITARCVLSWINARYGSVAENTPAIVALSALLDGQGIVPWNDAFETTFSEILTKLQEADI